MNFRINIKKSITMKLFLITVAFLFGFIIISLLFQSFSFEKFYQERKMSTLKKNLESFKYSYNNASEINNVLSLINTFENHNNCKIVILDSTGSLNFITSLSNDKEDSSKVEAIKEVLEQWASKPDTFLNMKKQNKTLTYIFRASSDIKNIVCVVPNNEEDEVMFAVSSLKPVEEASSVINEFYIYIFMGATALAIILSIIYTNMISKPLIKLNSTATKMANLNFSEKCVVTGEDEIGNLASTLNFLSENLNSSLTSLQAANDKLTLDIENERKLEKMRKEFVAGVSHELKTPISLIEGYAEALKDGIAAENETDYYLDVIIDESKKMGSLVFEMLDLSQLEYGRSKLNMEVFNVSSLLNSTIKKYSSIISEKNIKVNSSFSEESYVFADRYRIDQVINNFFTNAIRHTPEAGTININLSDKDNDTLIEIENTGTPIPEEEKEKIWEKFYRVDKSRNRTLGGTGLGLSIVKNILNMHGSSFGVNNTDIGVKFYFTLKKGQI
jgi:two-component system sensor histidine kinase VanS